jgi:proteasome lid subunit RPN8/RPN11
VAGRLATLAEADPDREICGLIEAGPGGALRAVPLANRAAEPAGAFALAPADVLAALRREAAGEGRLLAVYHSHPRGGPDLSARDLAEALAGGQPVLPGLDLVVVALRGGRAERVRWHRWDGKRYRAEDAWIAASPPAPGLR